MGPSVENITAWKTWMLLFCLFIEINARPQNSISLISTTLPSAKLFQPTLPSLIGNSLTKDSSAYEKEISDSNEPQPPPVITKVHVRSDIQYRYAKTVVETSIKNPSTTKAQEVFFNMVLPDTAFTSNFTIKLVGDDKLYIAEVAKKEDAQDTYNDAVKSGQSVGLVNTDTRDANRLSVSVNLEAAGKLTFTLTYEELLKRVHSKYEYILHVQPGQIVKDYRVDVYLNESLPLRSIHVPELKTNPNEITSQLKANAIANIERDIDGAPNMAHVVFKPDIQYQKLAAKSLEKQEDDGMFGQFIVQYDVDLSSTGGNEIQVLDGYFVHYFAPENLQTLPRHVIFVVDVSGSMSGTKLKQTKDAMVTILDDMTEQDYFDIITFSTDVSYWQTEITREKAELIESTTTTTTTTTEDTTTEDTTTVPVTVPPYLQVQQNVQQPTTEEGREHCAMTLSDSGSEPNTPCVFPFKFNGKLYDGVCTNVGDPDGKYWCSTKTRKRGRRKHQHWSGGAHWGFCQSGCDIVPTAQVQQAPHMQSLSISKPTPFNPYRGWDDPELEREIKPDIRSLVHSATAANKRKALQHVLGLHASGGTNINDALLKALTLVEDVKKSERLPENVRPTIIFLTDGEPTVGVTSSSEIRRNVEDRNKELSVPIFGLAFGVDPDFALVKNIAIESGAFARRIYETSDAAIQLEDFHSRIASPLLYDVQFKYVGGSFTDQTTIDVSDTFYKGGEYIIAGKIQENVNGDEQKQPKIIIQASQYVPAKYEQEIHPCHVGLRNNSNVENLELRNINNSISKRHALCIPIQKPTTIRTSAENFIERLWAFLTIQNLLDETPKKDRLTDLDAPGIKNNTATLEDDNNIMNTTVSTPKKSDKEKALDIALKYNFVTEVTSLVVKKPNENGNESVTNVVSEDPEEYNDMILPSSLSASKSSASYSTSYVNQQQVNYGYSQKVYIPKGGLGGSNFGGGFISGGSNYGAPNYSIRGGASSSFQVKRRPVPLSGAPPPSIYGPQLVGLSAALPSLTTTRPAYYQSGTTTTYTSILPTKKRRQQVKVQSGNSPIGQVAQNAVNDLADGSGFEVAIQTTTENSQERDPAFLDCKIGLYSKTYLRGDIFNLDKQNTDSNDTLSIKDLSNVGFDNKQTSLLVGGGANDTTRCCWGVYSEPNFAGEFLHFRFAPYSKGKYNSAQDMGLLFRDASSIQLLDEDCRDAY